MVMIFGEITTSATVNYEQVIRDALKEIGYDDVAKGLDYRTCNVIVSIEEQSPDIAQSVDASKVEDLGAGDQGIMFGYATDETESLMPLTHNLATSIGAKLTEVRKNGTCHGLDLMVRPKSLVNTRWTTVVPSHRESTPSLSPPNTTKRSPKMRSRPSLWSTLSSQFVLLSTLMIRPYTI